MEWRSGMDNIDRSLEWLEYCMNAELVVLGPCATDYSALRNLAMDYKADRFYICMIIIKEILQMLVHVSAVTATRVETNDLKLCVIPYDMVRAS